MHDIAHPSLRKNKPMVQIQSQARAINEAKSFVKRAKSAHLESWEGRPLYQRSPHAKSVKFDSRILLFPKARAFRCMPLP